MDFITHLPTTANGFDSVFVVVDRLSKMAHFIPTTTTVTAEEAAHLFMVNFFRLHGMPKTIVSDRDPKFTSGFWKGLMSALGCTLAMSSGYHPQTDGQTERTNRTLEEMLRAYCGEPDQQQKWDEFLPIVEFRFNDLVSSATGHSPFYLNTGQHPHTPATLLAGTTYASEHHVPVEVDQYVNQVLAAEQSARTNMELAQERAKSYYDSSRVQHTFSVGDMVYVNGNSLPSNRRGTKLSPLRFGPYKIAQAIGPVAFRLDTPATWRVHNVFHVSALSPADPTRERKVVRVVNSKVTPQGDRYFLVGYEDLSDAYNKWISYDQLIAADPSLFVRWLRQASAMGFGFLSLNRFPK
jgi:hypothetical protein